MPRKMSGGGGDAGALGEITNHGAAAAAHAKGAMPFADGAGSRVFAGMVFAFAGRFSAAQAALKGLIEGGGGSCAASVTLKVTHVISTRAAVEDEKRSAAIATAIGRGLPLLHEDFLARCVDEGKLLDLQAFSLTGGDADEAKKEAEEKEEPPFEEMLEAKREHDEAVACIEECVAQGLLSAGEAAEQRSMAARALMGAKADSGVSQGGDCPHQEGRPVADAQGSLEAGCRELGRFQVAADGAGREDGAHAAEDEPKRRRGRQAGSKNTPRTGLDDLDEKTLFAVCEDLGLAWTGDRAQATAAIHARSGSTAKTPKTNLDGLQEATLALICAYRSLDSSGDRAGLIARIQAGGPGKKAGREPRQAEQNEEKKHDKGAKKAKGKAGAHGTLAAGAAVGKPKRAATAYNLYLREEIARIKKADPVLTHKEAFKQAAANWGASKQNPEAEQDDDQRTGEDSETGEPIMISDPDSLHSSDQEDNSDDASSSDDAWDWCDDNDESDNDESVALKEASGLVFPVWHVAQIGEEGSVLEMTPASDAATVLTAVLEYLTAELVEVCGNAAKAAFGQDEDAAGQDEDADADEEDEDSKPRPEIQPVYIKTGVENDEELARLFDDTDLDVWKTPLCFLHRRLGKGVERVFGQIWGVGEMKIAKKGKAMMIMLLLEVVRKIREQLEQQMSTSAQQATVDDIKKAVGNVLPGELSHHALKEVDTAFRNREIAEAMKSVDKYVSRTHNSRWTHDEVAWLVSAVSTHLSSSFSSSSSSSPPTPPLSPAQAAPAPASPFPPNQKLLDRACEALSKCAGAYAHSKDQHGRRTLLVENGVIELIVSLFDIYFDMFNFQSDEEAKKQQKKKAWPLMKGSLSSSCHILTCLTSLSDHAENRVKVTEAGAIERLLKFVELYDADAGEGAYTLNRALEALSSLSQHPEGATKVNASGGIDTIMRAFATHAKQDRDVHQHVFAALASIAQHDDALRNSLTEAGAITSIVGRMNQWSNAPYVKREALRALGALVQDSRCIPKVIEAGAIKEVCSALKSTHMGNSEIEGASNLIAGLASTVENCQKLADAGYIELLTSSLAASSPGTCEVLAQIASASSDLQERTKAAGAVERLTAILADENLMCKTKEPAQRLLKLLTALSGCLACVPSMYALHAAAASGMAAPAPKHVQQQASRMKSDAETAVTMLTTVTWTEVKPQKTCVSELLTNGDIRAVVPDIDMIADDVGMKVLELQFAPGPVKLEDDCLAAIAAYTHDLMRQVKTGNLYYELNQMLRKRGAADRAGLMTTWAGYMYYMMVGLGMLPDFQGVCWRGYNHGSKEDILRTYSVGRPIQWGAFTSVTTSRDAAKEFAPDTRVVFKITVTSGRDINPYSFFPQEGEILLSPNHRFTVSSAPYEEAGYTFIDMVQIAGNTFVS